MTCVPAQEPPKQAERLAHLRYAANPNFVGRERELNQIHEMLFRNPTAVLTQKESTGSVSSNTSTSRAL